MELHPSVTVAMGTKGRRSPHPSPMSFSDCWFLLNSLGIQDLKLLSIFYQKYLQELDNGMPAK